MPNRSMCIFLTNRVLKLKGIIYELTANFEDISMSVCVQSDCMCFGSWHYFSSNICVRKLFLKMCLITLLKLYSAVNL